MWSRQESLILRDVTTTNPLESYHSRVKAACNSCDGLKDVARVLDTLNTDIYRKSLVLKAQQERHSVSLIPDLGFSSKVPLRYAQLLSEEYRDGKRLFDCDLDQ